MTPTLHDVIMLIGLLIDGALVTGYRGSVDKDDLCGRQLG